MAKYKRIYIFRHGESTFNKQKKFTGWLDADLTSKGIKDAKKIARKLKDKNIDVAFHSSLKRSVKTLNEVLKYHKNVEKILDNRIIERNYGVLQGKTHSSFVKSEGEKHYKSLVKNNLLPELKGYEKKDYIERLGEAKLHLIRRSYSIPPPGGESIKDVEKRVLSFIKDLLKLIKKEKVDVAISAHGNSMRPFRRYFENLTVKEMMSLENPWDDYFEYKVKID